MRPHLALLTLALLTPAATLAAAPPDEGQLAQASPVRPIQPLPRSNKEPRGNSNRGPRGAQPQKARKGSNTIPVDIGIGPFAAFITGPVQDDQLIHTGLRLSVAAVIDRETIRENWDRVPPSYRGMAAGISEARVKPLLATLLPTTLYLSPKLYDTGVWGATWELFGLGVPIISDPVRLSVDAGLIFTYLFIHSDTLSSPTHFVRPGLEFSVDLEIPFTDDFLMSIGWASQLHPPQKVGGYPWEFWPLDETIWHSGLLYLQWHVRVPYAI